MMKTPGWYNRCFTGTRGRIVVLLRRAARTVNELAEALELTDNAVRAHLSTLERDGLVRQSGVRRGARKPNNAYELTPEVEHLLSRAYEPLLQQLLAILSERLPPEAVEELLREVGHRMAATYPPAAPGRDLTERVGRAAELLGEMGGLAETEERDGKWFIRSYSCPLSAAVIDHPELCLAVETLVGEVVGAPVRECCDRSETPRCCFEVQAPAQ